MLRTARFLLLFTIAYNLAEGLVAIGAGIADGSIALIAFGADSYLEVAAASVVLWRLSIVHTERSERAEEFVERFIAWTFLALATAIIVQVGVSLAGGDGASESIVGIALAVASVTIMPTVAIWKLRAAARSNTRSLAAEAKETLACAYLSVTLLIGLVANAVFGWWWLDPLTALLLVPWLVREGLEGVRGDEGEDEDETVELCSCRSCLYGLRRRGPNCRTPEAGPAAS